MGKRKGLSKKTRFEVFKRDGFKCQYCGAVPPDAILHVDHIVPVAAERQRIEREEFERNAKAKAEQEAREKLERERVEQERLAKENAEREAEDAKRRESMKPDLEKLRDYVAAIEAVPIPKVEDPAVYQIVLNVTGEVERMCQRVEAWIDEQAK